MKKARTERLDKEKVVAAAAEIADRDGIEALSLSGLAAVLGIRTPSLYTHIDSLAELRRLLGLRGLHMLNERLKEAALGRSGRKAEKAVADAYRDFVHEHFGIYAATLPTAPDTDREWSDAKDTIMETIRQSLQAYGVEGEEAIHVVRGLRSIIHGFATMEMSGGFKDPVDRDESFHRILEIFRAGIRGES